MGTMIPWPGGKFRATKDILPFVPDHEIYTEPFCGGAKLLFAKARAKCEVINDIDGELINLFQVVRDKPQEFLDSFEWLLVGRQQFNELRDMDIRGLSDVERARRSFYLIKFSVQAVQRAYSKHITKGWSLANALKRVRECYERLVGVSIENLDYAEVISYYDSPETFHFVDPPYLELSKRLYVKAFDEEDFVRLRDVLTKTRGHWL